MYILNFFKGIIHIFGNISFLRHRELDEKIDTTLMSVKYEATACRQLAQYEDCILFQHTTCF